MRLHPACFFPLLLLPACGEATPGVFDATITFSVIEGLPSPKGKVLSKEAVAYVAIDKAGRTPIVDAWQEDAATGTRYGRHRFPRYTGAPALAAYYVLVLNNAGWEVEKDYTLDEESAVLRLHGVRVARAGADSDEIRVVVKRSFASRP